MEQWEFLIREAVRSPEMELKVRAVFAGRIVKRSATKNLKKD